MRMPAEWAPHDSVWIGYPSAPDLWADDLEGARGEVAAFARAVHAGGRGETVRLVCADEKSAASARDRAGDCAEILVAPFFDIWLRDTGPLVVDRADALIALDYRGNGWGGKYPSPLDDDLARLLCDDAGLLREPRDWILEGGAIDVDGAGLCVTTGQCLLNPNRNPGLSRRDIEELRQAVDRIKGELREMRRRLECFPHKLAKLMIAQGGLIAGLVVFLERLLKP